MPRLDSLLNRSYSGAIVEKMDRTFSESLRFPRPDAPVQVGGQAGHVGDLGVVGEVHRRRLFGLHAGH